MHFVDEGDDAAEGAGEAGEAVVGVAGGADLHIAAADEDAGAELVLEGLAGVADGLSEYDGDEGIAGGAGDRLDAGGHAEAAEVGYGEEVFHDGRQGAESVLHIGTDGGDLRAVGDVGEALVEGKAGRQVGDIVGGDGGGDGGKVDARGRGSWLGGCAVVLVVEFLDGLGEEFGVEVESDGVNLAALVGAEEVAGAADFEVAHGDAEAGAEFVGL